MMKTILLAALGAGLILTAATRSVAANGGDADAGGDVFDTSCSDCHSVSPKGISHKGPTLYGVLGRRAGIVPGFAYSAAMKGSGITWTPEKLAAYLTSPQAVVPGGSMKFKGLVKPQDRANVIAYLSHPD